MKGKVAGKKKKQKNKTWTGTTAPLHIHMPTNGVRKEIANQQLDCHELWRNLQELEKGLSSLYKL